MKKTIHPYLFLAGCGLLAYAPVSFMLRALKNDIVALEYPINYFISQCVRNGEIPLWFDSWGMGFPLQSSLTWGIYSTPQVLFSSLFNYNIYILHAEFMFFVLLSGWSMFYLLKKHFLSDERMAVLLSACYMLSGFMVGSTQWLLYITAAAFVPLLIATLLQLLKKPTTRNAFIFAICYTLMFTSVYSAFNIITTYGILVFLGAWFWKNRIDRKGSGNAFRHLLLAGLFTSLLCGPILYHTVELLSHLDRGDGLSAGSAFFNSNYLHPRALSSMLLPFSSVGMRFPNTEGTMLNTYAGLFVLILLPFAIIRSCSTRNRGNLWLLGAAITSLLFAFGSLTPAREALNLLPGFSYFRNPAIFRYFFLLLLILFLAKAGTGYPLNELLKSRVTVITIWVTGILLTALILFLIPAVRGGINTSLSHFTENLTYSRAALFNAILQLVCIIALIVLLRMDKTHCLKWVFAAELVLNTLLCTPFFSVSRYSLPELQSILRIEKGFPVQSNPPASVPAVFVDKKGNRWQNINVFAKEVSSRESYRGPLVLKKQSGQTARPLSGTEKLAYAGKDSSGNAVKVIRQRPGTVQLEVTLDAPDTITLMQNYYPGWFVYVNGNSSTLVRKERPGLSVTVPSGKNNVEFKFVRTGVWTTALILHLLIIGFGLTELLRMIRKKRFRSSSPSSPY
ncbi:MAG: YfhO family protein [Chitinophagaceae bacterium]